MRERDLIRDTLSVCDDIDARLSRMTPRERMYAEEWARAYRDFVWFLVGIGSAVLACLAMGGM